MVKICNRLIEDENRRREGAFFTPTAWVNEAHCMIEKELGEDWKNKYVVWDCCSGTGNLTRDYNFKELYCSTLLQEELDIAKSNKTNPEAVHFKYDFLDLKKESLGKLRGEGRLSKFWDLSIEKDEYILPEGLLNALKKNKKIVFFMNPPYGGAGNMRMKEGKHKGGIGKSSMNDIMKERDMDSSASQLYAQFIYRIMICKEKYNLDNVIIAFYSKPLFLSGPSYEKFRNKFLNEFEYKSGMLFQASHFSDVSTQWGVSFTIWKNGITENKNNFKFELKDLINDKIEVTGIKYIYNLDDSIKASEWIRKEIKGIKTHKNCIQLTNGLKPKLEGKIKASDIKNSIGYLGNDSNNVYASRDYVILLTSLFSHGGGLSIISENFRKCVSLFTARKSIKGNWINDKDEYSAPNTNHPDYEQWNNDAMVYSLFNTSSQQSSMRDIQWKDKTWDVKNEFFWLSRQKMLELGEKYHFDALQRDVEHDKERFLHEELQSISLSPDAQELLDRATHLLEKTFEYRKELNRAHPEYNLQCWDAGFYQIKIILKEHLPEDLKEFNKLYKAFENRMREGVFKFGFLRE